MPHDIVALLVTMGWNPPDDTFRNAWVRAVPTHLTWVGREEMLNLADLILATASVVKRVSGKHRRLEQVR